MIDQQKHESWFGNSLSEEEIKNNIGRRSTELGLQYLSDFLLRRRCDDVDSGVGRAESEVFASLSKYWSLQELEAMQLWDRLDEKLTLLGGCTQF